MFLRIHIHMNSYLSKKIAILPVPSHNIFKIWLGIVAMTSKDTQRRLVKENKNWPRDPNILDVRRKVSSRSPLSDLKCPMQIIIFLGQDDHFYLSTKSSLNHCHHPALKADAILHGQNDLEQGDLDLLSLLFSVNATSIQIHKLCKAWRVLNQAHIFLKEYITWIRKRNSYRTWHLD